MIQAIPVSGTEVSASVIAAIADSTPPQSNAWEYSYGNGTITADGDNVLLEGASGQISMAGYNVGSTTGKIAINLAVTRNSSSSTFFAGVYASNTGSDIGLSSIVEGITFDASTLVAAYTNNNGVAVFPVGYSNTVDFRCAILIDCDTGEWGVIDNTGTYTDNCGVRANGLPPPATLGNISANTKIYPIAYCTRSGGSFSADVTILSTNISGVPAGYTAIY